MTMSSNSECDLIRATRTRSFPFVRLKSLKRPLLLSVIIALIAASLCDYYYYQYWTVIGLPYAKLTNLFQYTCDSYNSKNVGRIHRSRVAKNNILTSVSSVEYFVEPLHFWGGVDEEGEGGGGDHSIARVIHKDSGQGTTTKEIEAEALATLNLAVEFRDSGKKEKARRLFEHALAMAPTQPDILNEYGVFMENHAKDVLLAEKMYTKALIYSPWHEDAIKNRARTQPMVEDIDFRMLSSIDQKREFFLRIPRSNRALRRAMKEAYFEHIYHTVAIEGNTFTYAETRSVLETKLAVGGKSVLEHNEVLGMDAALRYLNRTLIGRIGALTLQDIKQIHLRVLGSVDPVESGHFRSTQVFVGSFTPPLPSDIHREMEEFIEWINADSTLQIHPVELAALGHYKFVYIHPFIDGNGRTARLLMNLILMQAGFPPVIIRMQDRLEYYDTLTTANQGDLRPFIRFIARCTDKTLEGYLNAATARTQSTENDKCRTAEITNQKKQDIILTEEHNNDGCQ